MGGCLVLSGLTKFTVTVGTVPLVPLVRSVVGHARKRFVLRRGSKVCQVDDEAENVGPLEWVLCDSILSLSLTEGMRTFGFLNPMSPSLR